MNVKYSFKLDDGKILEYDINVDRAKQQNLATEKDSVPDWVSLSYCKCSNCPLKENNSPLCPAAYDIQAVVKDFRSQLAHKKAQVDVVTPERSYSKRASIEEGLRSLMGLILATSQCPVLGKLKPMAMHHMPFSSNNEFILRTVSGYLLQQYFEYTEGNSPDWDLNGLVKYNQELQLVNQALWQRIHSSCDNDSNLKALLSFFTMSSSVSFSLKSQLQKLKQVLDSEA
tara:strand:+ start:73452 stop:74135 length:684 start_codon:yes stop_codon:yes gene_type:complete